MRFPVHNSAVCVFERSWWSPRPPRPAPPPSIPHLSALQFSFCIFAVEMPVRAVALVAAVQQCRLLGKLLRQGGPQAASVLPYIQRRDLKCSSAAASSKGAGLGSGGTGGGASNRAPAAAAAAVHPAAADAAEAEDTAFPFLDEEEIVDDEITAPGILPRKLGAEAVEASRTGAFQRLPMVAPSKELLESALRRAARVPYNKKLKNEAQKAKNR